MNDRKIGGKRLVWLDIAKGLAICLMVLGHSGIPDGVNRWIFSFHMPLFFIASGITSNYSVTGFDNFYVRKFRSLIIPFLIYSVLLAIGIVLFNLEYSLLDILRYGWGGFALWFVPVLFLSQLLVYCIYLIKNSVLWALVFFTLPIISLVLSITMRDVWSLAVVPYSAFFIMVGSIEKVKNVNYNVLLAFIGFVLSIIISHYWKLDMAWCDITPILPKTLGALCGTYFVFFISRKFANNKVLSFIFLAIGRETFMILAFSQFCLIVINKYLQINAIFRYLILVCLLYLMVLIKNVIVKAFRRYILN